VTVAGAWATAMSDYPIQGKLRIRAANAEQDIAYIRAHTGELTEPELRSVPGYEFLRFWYADFACTDQQWAALAPELDKRNILATLYEAPVFAAEVAAKEEEPKGPSASPLARILNLCALLVVLAAAALLLTSTIDGVACASAGVAAILLVIAGQAVPHAKVAQPDKP